MILLTQTQARRQLRAATRLSWRRVKELVAAMPAIEDGARFKIHERSVSKAIAEIMAPRKVRTGIRPISQKQLDRMMPLDVLDARIIQ